MSRNRWLDIKKMNEEELKSEFANIAKEVQELTRHVGMINNDEEEEEFSSDVAYCIDTLHSLKTVVLGIYFNNE